MNTKFTPSIKAVGSFAVGISMAAGISCFLVACGGGSGGGDNSASTSLSTGRVRNSVCAGPGFS